MLRRNFVKLSAAGFAAVMYSRLTFANAIGNSLINHPDEAWAQVGNQWVKLTGKGGAVFSHQDIRVEVKTSGNAQAVYVQAPVSQLQAIKFKWNYQTAKYNKIFGDHWERGYGDLAWRSPDAGTKNPWYVLLHDDKQTACFGVKTGANTMSYWEVKPAGIELIMDT